MFSTTLFFFQDERSSYFHKPNSHYGVSSYYSYTDKVSHDIFDTDGNKIGSYETDGATHSGWSTDECKYALRWPVLLVPIYMIIFPVLQCLRLIASFLSLFTSRFYVSREAPKDYNHIKYHRALHCFFHIVAERSPYKQKELEKRIKEKKATKEQHLEAKRQKKLAFSEKLPELFNSADKCLGFIMKVLGIIGVLIVLYFIIK